MYNKLLTYYKTRVKIKLLSLKYLKPVWLHSGLVFGNTKPNYSKWSGKYKFMKHLGNLFPISAVMGREFIAKFQCCRRRLLWPSTFSAEFTMCQDIQLCEKRAGVIQSDHMIFCPDMFFIYTYTHTLEEAKGLWSRCKIWAIAFQLEDCFVSHCTELIRLLLC